MHAKSRAIKSFIAELTIILLNEFLVTFECLMLVRFSIQLIHDLNTHTTHSSADMLYNVENNRRKEFLSDGRQVNFLD